MRTCILILSLLSAIPLSGIAQGKLGVFLGGGVTMYQGDLNESFIVPATTVGWTGNAGLHWQFHRRFGVQLNYTAGELKADDALSTVQWRRNRNLRFHSFIHEVSLRVNFDILPIDRWKVIPYVLAGVGALNFEPATAMGGTALRPLMAEGVAYSPWEVSFPTGIGVRYQIKCPWALKAEANYHWTLTDYLDDVSLRGNPNLGDGFWDINIGVIYYFLGCGKRKGNRYEDCDNLNKGIDMKKLERQYGM